MQEYGNLTDSWQTYDAYPIYDCARNDIRQDTPDLDICMQDQQFPYLDPGNHSEGRTQNLLSRYSPSHIPDETIERQGPLHIVRRWLAEHASPPYPTPTEKAELAASAGCSEHQLNICFRNVRAREKHLIDGHADVRSRGDATSLETCDNMFAHPGMQSSSVVAAHTMSHPDINSPPETSMNDYSSWCSSSEAGYPTPDDGPACWAQFFQNFDGESPSQVLPDELVPQKAAIPKRKGRMYHAQRYQDGAGETLHDAILKCTSFNGGKKSKKPFPCTACVQSFRNASEWKRHEAGVNGYNDREWTCIMTETYKLQAECVFCSEPMETVDHLAKHEITPCSMRHPEERSFYRKELLKQHVLHAHLANESASVRKNFTVPRD
ncbi:hypothetical protein G6011_11707 [Alternaria panax]|uniref:KN homeodomain domain-containing protein n=1 Tax=Alternaria panax TaxID=48097 RepID=A0AAD4IED9_9PLEO|nr:hypothetical protein G6011_11707 [Alternaria panax]